MRAEDRKKPGRKKLPDHMKRKYDKVSVLEPTAKRIRNNAMKRGQLIIEYMDEIVK